MKTGTLQVNKDGSTAQINSVDLPAWEANGWERVFVKPARITQDAPEVASPVSMATDAGTQQTAEKRGRGRPKSSKA